MDGGVDGDTTVTAPILVMPSGLVVDLPLPPTTNNAYANAPGRGRVLTSEARAWKQGAVIIARSASKFGPAVTPPLALHLFVYFADNRRDLDGAIKLAQDAVCEALGINDRHVHEVHAIRAVDRARPRLVVVVRSMEG
jgi:crossover junction endodeoxyribonuclease RusA